MIPLSLKSLKNCELSEYICTYYIPKGFFCLGVEKGCVNLVNLVFFEVHRIAHCSWLIADRKKRCI